MHDLHRVVATPLGPARVALVDRWLGIGRAGDLLERDVWHVVLRVGDLEVDTHVRTFPGADDDALAAAIGQDLRDVATA